MFPLFSFSNLISFTDEDGFTDEKLKLVSHTYADTGDRSLLCLNFTLGKLFLWQKDNNGHVLNCWLPWFTNSKVINTRVDPTGSWLLVLTSEGALYIVPVRYILDPSAKVDQIWRLDTITKIKLKRNFTGVVTCMVWWKTLSEENVAILGTLDGQLIFFDLVKETELMTLDLEGEHILDINILCNDSMTVVYALITTKTNTQFRLLLEKKMEIDATSVALQNTADFAIQNQYKTIYKLFSYQDRDYERFRPKKIFEFGETVLLSEQNARGHHFIAAYDLSNSILKIFRTDTERYTDALFVYKLPRETDEILYCDKLTFAASRGDRSSFCLLSNRLSEVADETQKVQHDVTMQRFQLASDEHVISLHKRTFPFNWYERQKEEARPSGKAGIVLKVNTVFDGCIVVTNQGIYECQPRLSPERIFADLCVMSGDLIHRERIAASCGIDVCSLAKQMAEYKLSIGEVTQAKQLFSLVKCSEKEVCLLFAKYGHIRETLGLCRKIVVPGSKIQGPYKELAVRCYVQLILSATYERESVALQEELKEFVLNYVHDTKSVWELLQSNGLYSLMWLLARESSHVIELIERYISTGGFYLDEAESMMNRFGLKGESKDIEELIIKPAAHLLVNLESRDLGHLLDDHLDTWSEFLDMVEDQMDDLSTSHIEKLLNLLNLADMTTKRQLFRVFANHQQSAKVANDQWSRFVSMVTIYLHALLHAQVKTHETGDRCLEVSETFTPKAESTASNFFTSLTVQNIFTLNIMENSNDVLQCSYSRVSASTYVNYVIQDGGLISWGRVTKPWNADVQMFDDSVTEVNTARVSQSQVFFPDDVTVLSVSSGLHHTLALTSQGVYTWGKSRYGQLGLGVNFSYANTPVLLTSLKYEHIVRICCGQHHSMALTEDGRVYTWGWGVFGQLGHGNAEDVHIPRLVTALQDQVIVSMAAGQAHSIFLTDEGKVLTCGCNAYGQLGTGNTTKQSLPTRVKNITKPVTLIATKHFHSLALMTDGRVCQWGMSPIGLRYFVAAVKKSRAAGNIVPSYRLEQHLTPCLIDTSQINGEIMQLECGADFSALVTDTGNVFTWGKNMDGQLGCGSRQNHETTPTHVVQLDEVHVVQITCGPDFSLVMDSRAHVLGWGRNELGQLLIRAPMEIIRKVYRHGVQEKNLGVLTPIDLHFKPNTTWLAQRTDWELVPESKERKTLRHLYDMFNTRGNLTQLDVPQHLHDCLKIIGEFVNTDLLLRKANELQNEACLWVIYTCLGRQSDAFVHRLNSLKQNYVGALVQGNKEAEIQNDVLSIFEGRNIQEQFADNIGMLIANTLSDWSESENSNSTDVSDIQEKIVNELYQMWRDNNLPIRLLENILTHHLADLGYAIFDLQSREALKHGQPVIEFSTQFNLELTLNVITNIEAQNGHPSKLENKLKELAFSSMPFESVPSKRVSLKSNQDLWEKIMDKMQESNDPNSKSVIISDISIRDKFDTIEATNIVTSVHHSYREEIEFRCCTHKVSFSDFADLLCGQDRRSFDGVNKSDLLWSYYDRNNRDAPFVCPKCVLFAIRSSL